MKKTLKGWHRSGIDLDKYLPEPCEIDEGLFNYFGEIVAPKFCIRGFVQLGECEYHDNVTDIDFYSSASHIGDKYFYLGILPEFK